MSNDSTIILGLGGAGGFELPPLSPAVERTLQVHGALINLLQPGSPLVETLRGLDLESPAIDELLEGWDSKVPPPIEQAKTLIEEALFQARMGALNDPGQTETETKHTLQFAIHKQAADTRPWYVDRLSRAGSRFAIGMAELKTSINVITLHMDDIDPMRSMRLRPLLVDAYKAWAEMHVGPVPAVPKNPKLAVLGLLNGVFDTGVVFSKQFSEVVAPYIEEVASVSVTKGRIKF